MNITRYFLILNLVLAAGFASYAYLEKYLWAGSGIVTLWIILWLLSHRISDIDVSSAFFTGYLGICLVGIFLELRLFILFLGTTMALNAWDADRFCRRWKTAQSAKGFHRHEIRHIFRILAVDGLAILLSVAGLSFRTHLGFGIMLLLGALALFSLSRLIFLLRNQLS